MMKLQTCFQAKSTLGFSPSTCIDEITDEKLHTKFTQKLVEVSFLEFYPLYIYLLIDDLFEKSEYLYTLL